MQDVHARLTWPIAVAAGGGAAVVASATRWWLIGRWHGPVAVATAVICGAVIGAMITHWLRVDGTASLRFRVSSAVLVTGPFAAVVVAAVCDSELLGPSALAGAALSLGILPFAFGAAWLAERSRRSRARSVVGWVDRRAPWRVTATWLAAISIVGMIACSIRYENPQIAGMFWWSDEDRAVMAVVPLTVAWIGWIVAAIVALSDMIALRTARRVPGEGLRAATEEIEHDGELDLGVGDTAWIEHVSGMTSYRSEAVERVALRGDREVAPRLLFDAARASMGALWFAVLSIAMASLLRARL